MSYPYKPAMFCVFGVGTCLVSLFTAAYITLIVYGSFQEGVTESGYLAAGITGLVHCVLFSVLWFLGWCGFRCCHVSPKCRNIIITVASVLFIFYLGCLIAIIVVGEYLHNRITGTAMVVAGSMALGHALVFALVFGCIFAAAFATSSC